jgi:hypothetical protein
MARRQGAVDVAPRNWNYGEGVSIRGNGYTFQMARRQGAVDVAPRNWNYGKGVSIRSSKGIGILSRWPEGGDLFEKLDSY